MNTRDWTRAVLIELASTAPEFDLTVARRNIPADFGEIGHAPGTSFVLRDADEQQVGAVSRYEDSLHHTIALALPDTPKALCEAIEMMGRRIAAATDTVPHLQGALMHQ